MFFEKFREAVARLPAGLIRPGPAALPQEVDAAAHTLGRPFPASFGSFLASFDGADLFHEAVLIGGVGGAAPRRLIDLNLELSSNDQSRELVFAEAAGGDLFSFDAAGRVVRTRAESEERWRSGGDFFRWLDGVVAYHRVLYGPDGEFAPDAFDADGIEVLPAMALKQAERALRWCPDSAEWHHDRGVALRRLGRLLDAKAAFAAAAALDPDNPWPHFDHGRVALELGPAAAHEAGAAFEAAAQRDGGISAGRLWLWAARAAQVEALPERVLFCRAQALAREPALADQLRVACEAARAGGDPDEIAETTSLLDALEAPVERGRHRLAVLHDHGGPAAPAVAGPAVVSDGPAAPTRRTPPPGPRRPGRAGRRRSGGHPPARRR